MARKMTMWALVAVMMLSCITGAFAETAPVERTVEAVYDGAWVNIAEHSFKLFLPDGWQLIEGGAETALLTAIDPETGNSMWIESMEGEGFTIEGVLEMFSGEEGFADVQLYLINGKPFVHYTSPESNTRGFITLTADAKHILIFKFSPSDDEAFAGFAETMMSTLSAYTPAAAKTKTKTKTKDEEEKNPVIQTWAELVAAAKAGKTEILIGANLRREDGEETAVFHTAVTIKGLEGNMYTLDGNGQQIIRIESGTDEPLTDTSTISDLMFVNGQGHQGGALYAEGDLIVESCVLLQNTAEANGGAIYVTGDLALNEATLANNSTGEYYAGGGAFALGDVTIINSTFASNEAACGGGLYAAGDVTMEGVTIVTNSASAGGGVYSEGTVTMNGGTIAANKAETMGGGVYASDVVVNDGNITANQAANGGGICTFGDGAVVNGGMFAGNSAEMGSAIYAEAASDVEVVINGGTFIGNTTQTGSPVYTENGTITDPNNIIPD